MGAGVAVSAGTVGSGVTVGVGSGANRITIISWEATSPGFSFSYMHLIRRLHPCRNIPFTKISIPMPARMIPPSKDAFQESLVPAFFPICRPPRQIRKVTAPMISEAAHASSALYDSIVNPTDSASMDVAIP